MPVLYGERQLVESAGWFLAPQAAVPQARPVADTVGTRNAVTSLSAARSTKKIAAGDRHCAVTAQQRTRRANLRRHRCNCWTTGPTAEAAKLSNSTHRDAPAVNATLAPQTAMRELELRMWGNSKGFGLGIFAQAGPTRCASALLKNRKCRRCSYE